MSAKTMPLLEFYKKILKSMKTTTDNLLNNFDLHKILLFKSFLKNYWRIYRINDRLRRSLWSYMRLTESQKSELFKFRWHMETWSWCSCRIHSQISGWFFCWYVNSEKIGIKWVACFISKCEWKINCKMSFPSLLKNLSWAWNFAAWLKITTEFTAVSWWIVDVREEKSSFWTDLKFPISCGVGVHGRNKDLNSILFIKRIIALSVGRNDLIVNIFPSDKKRFFIVTKSSPCGWVEDTVSVFKRETYTSIWAERNIDCCNSQHNGIQ